MQPTVPKDIGTGQQVVQLHEAAIGDGMSAALQQASHPRKPSVAGVRRCHHLAKD